MAESPPGAGRLTLWVDAQLSPHLSPWLEQSFDVKAFSVRRLGLRDANDKAIFDAARDAGVVVLTKDSDFVRLVDEIGPPPQILWLTCGNTSNLHLKFLFRELLPDALELLERGEIVVEIRDTSPPA